MLLVLAEYEPMARPNNIRSGEVATFPVMRGMNPWNMTDGEIADHLRRFRVPIYDDEENPGSWKAPGRLINTASFYRFDNNDGIYLSLYPDGEGGMPDAMLKELIAYRKSIGRVVTQQFLDNVAAARTKFGRDPIDPYGEKRKVWVNHPFFPGNDRLFPPELKKKMDPYRDQYRWT